MIAKVGVNERRLAFASWCCAASFVSFGCIHDDQLLDRRDMPTVRTKSLELTMGLRSPLIWNRCLRSSRCVCVVSNAVVSSRLINS